MNIINVIANIAAILTAIVALVGYGIYRWDRCAQRRKLETYLKAQKENQSLMLTDNDQGQRSLLHLMAKVGMTEGELIQASFRSNHIKRVVATDRETGRANALLLEWSE